MKKKGIWQKFFGRSAKPGIIARFDVAQTNINNTRHWAEADHLSPNAALLPAVRRVVRSRARYEVANNSYAAGLVNSLGDYIIGTGPRLQVRTENSGFNRTLEALWKTWSDAIDLGSKLHTMKVAQATSGEVFALLETNDLLETPAKLDIRIIEADQVSDPLFTPVLNPNMHDGVITDVQGHPISYRVLRHHPGDTQRLFFGNDFDEVPAEFVIHLFHINRPGQQRGIPQITPALPLFAQLRRYTLAVLSAAEAAALPSGVIYTDAPANDLVANVDAMDTVEMDRNTWLTMPAGWKVGQFKAEQPTSTYAEFKREILNEIARSLSIPYNIAAGNSSEYNYASGRLDHQAFFKSISVERRRIELTVMDRIFRAWLVEMAKEGGRVPKSVLLGVPHEWFWDGVEHVDPKKEAEGQTLRLQGHTTTLATEYAKQGKDWQTELEQRAKEIVEMKRLGLDMEEAKPQSPGSKDEESDNDGN